MHLSDQPTKLLFIGDSITDAFRRPEEINESFQLGNGYVFLIAAHLRYHYPEAALDFVNRGVSGETLKNIVGRWEADVIPHQPQVVTLLAGVNDLIRMQQKLGNYSEPAEFAERLRSTLERTRAALPETKLVLMEPFVLEAGMVESGWREALQPYQKIVREQSEAFQTEFIPLQSVFDAAVENAAPAHWSYDGVHPNPGGFYCIAKAWLTQMNYN